MKSKDFIAIAQQTEPLSWLQINQIKAVIQDFPYMQSARAIYLKGLKQKKSYLYQQELKTTAIYSTDRSVLFDFMTSKVFSQHKTSQLIQENNNSLNKDSKISRTEEQENKEPIVDHTLNEFITATEGVLNKNLFEKKADNKAPNKQEPIKQKPPATPKENRDTENAKTPNSINTSESHPFIEWLKLTTHKPSSKPVSELNTELPIDKKMERIDAFLNSNPKIIPSKKTAPIPNIAEIQNLPNDGIMTETLAHIYVKQKKYDKAIQSYKILSLKYPEKNGFFADQIKTIKQLQENSNTN